MKNKLEELKSIVESTFGDRWWIDVSGEAHRLKDTSHQDFVIDNPHLFNMDEDDFMMILVAPLWNGAIRIISNPENIAINLSEDVTDEAFKRAREFVRNRSVSSIQLEIHTESGKINDKVSAKRYPNFRRVSQLIKFIKEGGSSIK